MPLLGALAPEPPDGFPWASALPSAHHHLPLGLEEDGRVSTKQVAGPSFRSLKLLLVTRRHPRGLQLLGFSSWFSFLRRLEVALISPRVCFCFSFQSNSHLALFSPRRVLSPRGQFF